MSFLVIIASLIAFMILIEKILIFIEPVGRYNIGSVSVIGIYLK